MSLETLLESCGGVRVEKSTERDWLSQTYSVYRFYKEGDIKLPAGEVFIEVTATATKGTIGRLVDIEINMTGRKSDEFYTFDVTLIYEVDGRKNHGRISSSYARILAGTHQTKYVRNVKSHDKTPVKNPVNKYLQELRRGDWVIGVRQDKRLGIGRITRWTAHNVWAVTGDNLDDKTKEFKFNDIKETFTMPDDKHVQLLTVAVLKGWRGN